MNRHIFVTGGAGYIGSHVCKALHDEGFIPVAFDNMSSGHAWAVQWGPLVEGDLHDSFALRSAFEKFSPLAVIHMASSINVRESLSNPALFYHNNVGGSLTLLQAMVASGISYIVFSSTAAVYGKPHHLPMDEKHPLAPLNAYGKSKLTVEGMIEDFFHAHGIRYASLRYFNACGADPDGKIGEAHDPETHLIPLVMKTALSGQPPISIFGDDYPTPDGTAVRDYIHVADLADAHVKAIEHLIDGGDCLKLNLGTGEGFSVREIIDAVASYTGRPIPYTIKPRLIHDSPALIADAGKAQEILDWTPRYSDLSTIIATAWKWHSMQEPAALLSP